MSYIQAVFIISFIKISVWCIPMNCLHDNQSFAFASDNYAGIHPKILQALMVANGGHQPAYGADVYTIALRQKIKQLFGEKAEAFPVFNGTGANITALQALLPRWGAVICADSAHFSVMRVWHLNIWLV
jgi:threonine aldolase